jgi:hypothetical protein
LEGDRAEIGKSIRLGIQFWALEQVLEKIRVQILMIGCWIDENLGVPGMENRVGVKSSLERSLD